MWRYSEAASLCCLGLPRLLEMLFISGEIWFLERGKDQKGRDMANIVIRTYGECCPLLKTTVKALVADGLV